MGEKVLFSVLIANYNNGCYIQKAINSVLAQEYDNWEVIIVDDKSPDDSAEIYNRYRNDSRFHVFFNDKNMGVGYTKRRCVEMANGEICGFLDPDDVLVGTDVISAHVSEHIKAPDVSMVYSGMYRANENLEINREEPGKDIEIGGSLLQTCSWPIHHFVTFRKDKYNQTKGIDPLMRRAEDYDLYYKLEEAGGIIHLDRLEYIQRNNPHSISLNDNAYKASAWHTYACVQAMRRRGLTDESLMLFPIEAALRNEFRKGYKKATTSRIYKAGKIVASPFLIWRRLWKK